MNGTFDDLTDQAKAFQKMWMDSFSKMMVAGLGSQTSGSPPPEAFREMRSGVFKAMAQSWEDFMRTPEFLKTMKQSMDTAIATRNAVNEFFNRAQHEFQGVNQEDFDHLMSAISEVRHRVDEINEKLSKLEQELKTQKKATPTAAPRKTPKAKQPVKKKAAKKAVKKTVKRKR